MGEQVLLLASPGCARGTYFELKDLLGLRLAAWPELASIHGVLGFHRNKPPEQAFILCTINAHVPWVQSQVRDEDPYGMSCQEL